MALSLNQVEHTARKAVRGAGLPWGLAEDAGRAVRWLEMLDLPGMQWLSQLLQRMPHDQFESLRIGMADDVWRSTSEVMSPLLAGPSLMDWLGMQRAGTPSSITLNDVACPGLCAGYMAMAVNYHDLAASLAFSGSTMIMSEEGLVVAGEHQSLECEQTQRVVVTMLESRPAVDGDLHTARVGSRDIDPCALSMLESLAHKTYVEASEASRLSGAGAGLQDND